MIVLKHKDKRVVSVRYIYNSENQLLDDDEILLDSTDIYRILNKHNKKEQVTSITKSFIRDIISIIETAFEIRPNTLNINKRYENYVIARYTGMYILYKHHYGSLSKIASVFNKDHATVIHANQVIENILTTHDKRNYSKVKQCIDSCEEYFLTMTEQ